MSELAGLQTQVHYKMDLPGGQSRLREAILYVCKHAVDYPFFGLVKLNKILWRADFESFKDRRTPVTGRMYVKLKNGPAPYEMLPLLNELQAGNLLTLVNSDVPNERRPLANAEPVLNNFSPNDLRFLDEALAYYKEMTAGEASEDSHGLAWKTRDLGDPIPYDAAIFDDEINSDNLPYSLEVKFHTLAREKRLRSD
jgi:hypothetical protein